MKDLSDPRWIKLKGLMFLALGSMSGLLVLLEQPSLRLAALLSLTVWAFCRFYYFAFYVIERYVDSSHRFSGLWSFAAYLFRRRRRPEKTTVR